MIPSKFICNIFLAIPFYILSVVPFILLANYLEVYLELKLILIGALGWWVALLLRIPIILIGKSQKIAEAKVNKLVVGSSGPTEEIVRFVVLIILGFSFENAYSVGLGWAMIEVIYGLIQVIGIGVLEQKTDPKSMEAKELMKSMGMDKSLAPSTPFWGALERFSASGIHIGFTLLLLTHPIILLITIPFHSAINFFVVQMNKTSISKSQIGLLFIGILIFIAGLFVKIP